MKSTMRLGLTLLLVIHGALHVLGFLKLWHLAQLPELSGRTLVPVSESTGRAVGVAWILAMLLFFGAAALRLLQNLDWWAVALGGVLVSQALIVFEWPDAKVGTIANVLIAFAILVAAATDRFKANVSDEVRGLLARATRTETTAVRPPELDRLPQPVRRWLVRSGVVGKQRARTVRLKQRGEIRTSPGGAWMPAEAEQYFSVEPPAFVWSVDVTMLRVLPVVGRDRYLDGHGHMLIKALSLVNVVDAAGEPIDQGTLLRFLGEIVWFPSAALSPSIAWEPIDATHAKATMRHAGLSVSAVFGFDAHGRFETLEAERYLGAGPEAKLERWVVLATDWRKPGGLEIPVRGNVIWKLASGDFDYYRWEIVEVEYDATVPYPHA